MDTVRIDKWLWAARFFKTRSQASQAVSGGHVTLNGNRVKASRSVQAGDMLLVRRDFLEFTIKIVELSERRGPASVAQTLYEETADSVNKREALAEQRRILRLQGTPPERRPEKHERRKIRRFLKKE